MIATLRRTTLALALSVLASACGGGGGESGPTPDTTRPAVASFDPRDAATGVSRAATVVVTFSEAIDPATATSVTLEGPAGAVAVTRTLSAGNTVLTLEPAPLANYGAHTVTVGTGVKDAAGNAFAAAASATFTTVDDVGPVAPAGLSGPAFASIAAPSVTFTWSAPSDDGIGVIASYDVEVATSGGAPFAPVTVTSTTAALGDQRARDGEQLSARVRARDAAGNAGSWSEWSAPVTVDVTGPAAALLPAQGATGVARAGPFTVTFDEPVTPASLTASSVVLETLGGTPVAYAPDLGGDVLTVVPSAPLAPWGEYRIRVTPAVTDAAGNPLGATLAVPAGAGSSSTFRAADDAPPELAGGVSAAGAFDDATMTFTWPEATDVGAGVAGYEVRIALGFSSNLGDPTFVTTTAFVFDPRAWGDGTLVWAEVRPVDGALNAGAPELSPRVVFDGNGPTAPGQPQGPGAYALASPVRFAWAAAADLRSGVASYGVVAATSTTGGTPLAATDPGLSTSTDVTALVDGATVYVRVTAADRVGNVGSASAWSAPVTMDLAPPSAPGALTPPQGTIAASPVAFGWTQATDTNGIAFYELDVRTAAAGAGDAVFVGTTTVLSRDVAGADGQVLHARVRAVDAAGRIGPWSAPTAVTVDAAPPGAPGAPADGDLTDASLALSWDEAVDAVSSVVRYVGEVSADETFLLGGTLSFEATTAGTTLDVGAYDGQTVYVRVQAVDAFGHAGEFAYSDGVFVDATPPSLPGTPQDGGGGSLDPQLHFFWTPASDPAPGSGVAGYTCELAEGDVRTHLAFVETTTEGCDYVAAMNQRVFARVRARDAAGNEAADFTDWSDGILVTTSVPATPDAPQGPARYVATTTFPFTWPGSLGAGQSYRVQVGTSPGASDEANVPNHPVNVYPFTGVQGGTYYARVAIHDASTGFAGAFSESSGPVTVDLTDPGIPTGVAGRGPLDDEEVTFTWTAATDPESGIDHYEVEITADGVVQGTFEAPATSYAFGPATHGAQVTARVRAVNGAGRVSASWSAPSPAVTVDAGAPSAWPDLSNHQPHPTNVDLVLRFDEPMDMASVEGAFSVQWGAGERPAHGYVFHWTDPQRVVIVPDTQAPAGETNVDLLPEATDFVMTLGTGATDLAGNGLAAPMTLAFSTRDETEPSVAAIVEKRSGGSSPFDPAFVESVTLVVRFDEDMSPMQASARFQRPDQWAEGSVAGVGIQSAQTVVGGIAYTLTSCADVRVGDVVSVGETSPPDWQVSHAPVTDVAGFPCTVTVSTTKVPGAPFGGGGRMALPAESPGRPRLQWIAPRELQIELPPGVSMAAGDEARLELWNVGDLAWNSTWVREVVQVATTGEVARPVLLGSIPRDGATGVRGAGPVVLRFSEPLRASTVAAIAAECDGCAGLYELDYSVDEYGPIVLLAPRASPPAGTTVTVLVPDGVQDLAGNGAVAASVTFTVEDELEEGAPRVRDTSPPAWDGDARPVDQVWSLGFSFEDEETGLLETVDARSVGANDFRVVDGSTGLLVRGFRPRAEAGMGVVELRPTGNGSGLGAGSRHLDVTAVDAGAGAATYTTREPHGMEAPGGKVWVDVPGFQAWDAVVTAIPDANRFTIGSWAFGNAGGTGGTIGGATVPTPRSYDVEVLPALGSDGIVDAHGNALSPALFTIDVQPWGSRVPYVAQLQELRIDASTSPVARTLEVEARVSDADAGDVAVSLWDPDGILSGTTRDVAVGPWSGGSYRYPSGDGGGGPPTASSPQELAGYGASGWYPLELVLDDGVHETRYRREVWLWAPADAPHIASIGDAGLSRPVGDLPIGLESGDPIFAWTGLDAVNADLAALYVVSLEGVGDGRGGFTNVSLLPPQQEGSAALAVTLEPDVYLWTVVQQKFAPGTFDPASSAWAIDVSDFAKALFAVGPDNATLARPTGAVFAGARMGVDRTGGGGAAFDAVGTFTFEEPAGKVPVLVTAALDDQHAAPLPPVEELFAYGAGKRFTMTQTSAGLPMSLPMHGVVGAGATFFAVAQEDPLLPTFQAGAYRYQESGFGTALAGRFVFVHASANVTSGAGDADGSVGRAAFDPAGVVTLELTMNDGAEEPAFGLPYTLGDDGRLTIALEDAPDAGTATGLVGGAAGAEIVALAQTDADPGDDRYFWLLAVREYDWAPDSDESILAGTYRFADYSAEGGTSFSGARGSSGSMTFDGDGTVTYEGTSNGERFTGFGEYEVLPLEGKVIFTRLDGNPGPDRYTLVLGKNADVVLGGATDPDGGVAEVLVLAR